MTQRLQVVYLAGYGRSGSTILDMLLSCHPAIVSGGEIARATETFFDPDAACTCGETVKACPVWRPVRDAVFDQAAAFGGAEAVQARFMAIEGLHWRGGSHSLGAAQRAEAFELWRHANELALRALLQAKPGARWVVDSSKTARGAATRPLLLEDVLGADVRILTLRRRARDVLASAARGSNRAMEKGREGTGGSRAALKAYAGWVLANAAAKRLHLAVGEARSTALTYESLVADPDAAYARLLAWLGLPADPDWQARMATTERHLIGGNRTRFARPEIRRSAPPQHRDLLTTIGLAAGQLIARSRLI